MLAICVIAGVVFGLLGGEPLLGAVAGVLLFVMVVIVGGRPLQCTTSGRRPSLISVKQAAENGFAAISVRISLRQGRTAAAPASSGSARPRLDIDQLQMTVRVVRIVRIATAERIERIGV